MKSTNLKIDLRQSWKRERGESMRDRLQEAIELRSTGHAEEA